MIELQDWLSIDEWPRKRKQLSTERKMPIDKPYAYHKPSTDGLAKINRLREHFSEGERLLKEICPDSRQRSVALTNNETTAMWAIKSVVFNDPDSEVET
jgi:hypothetical protein